MSSSTTSPRFHVTMANGTVVTCNTPEDLTVALVAIGRSNDALSVQPSKDSTARRKPKTAPASSLVAGFGPGGAWSSAQVKKLLDNTTESAAAMVRMAVELGHGATVAALAEKLDTRAGACGPMIGKLARDAQALAPYLPQPLQTAGRAGHKTLVFDPSFLDAAKGVLD